MTVDPALIERIYEAAVVSERWPSVLQDVADRASAVGAVFIAQRPTGMSWLASPRLERATDDYMREGWLNDTRHTAPLFEDQWPGFCPETAYRTIEEIERLPVKTDFFIPRGLIAGVGTVLQGARDDVLHLALEGFPTHGAAEAAVPLLDTIRQHLGRALSLTALLRDDRIATMIMALHLAGVAAAVISGEGRLRVANDLFTHRLGERMVDRPSGVRFADRFLQAQFAEALPAVNANAGVRSIAVAASDDRPAFVIHLLPLKRGARDVFGWDGVLLLLAEAANASVPGADLLRLLFDLTPAEARLARHLIQGLSLAEAARWLGITEATGRVHLRRIFAKTGVTRQAELVRLLLELGHDGG